MKEEAKGLDPFLSESDKIVINQVQDLFNEVDNKTEEFRKITNLHCPDNCGVCCDNAKVYTTAIEMLPLAAEMWKRNEADL